MEEAFDHLDAPLYRVTAADVPLPYAANLEKLALPDVDDVIEGVRAVTAIAARARRRKTWPSPSRCRRSRPP